MPERDVGTMVAYSLSRGWTVLMLHLLPEECKTDSENRTDGQRGIQRRERVREKTQPDQGNQTPHLHWTERDSERGERVIWMN